MLIDDMFDLSLTPQDPPVDFVRRSTRIQNKDGQRGRERERVRKILNSEDEVEEVEEEGAVTYIPKGDPKKMYTSFFTREIILFFLFISFSPAVF